MKFDELTQDEQIRGINYVAKRAVKFNELDNCAHLARSSGHWKQCVDTIHRKNMVLLGKVRQGYAPAMWKKGFHEVTVVNERATVAKKRVHVRQLCKRGYKFIPVRRI